MQPFWLKVIFFQFVGNFRLIRLISIKIYLLFIVLLDFSTLLKLKWSILCLHSNYYNKFKSCSICFYYDLNVHQFTVISHIILLTLRYNYRLINIFNRQWFRQFLLSFWLINLLQQSSSDAEQLWVYLSRLLTLTPQ